MSVRRSACILFLAVLPARISLGQMVVIVHRGVPSEHVSIGDLRRIFTGKTRLWGNQERIQAVYLTPRHEKGAAILDEAAGMSARDFEKFWIKKTFSGDGTAPIALRSPEEIVDYVAKTPGAIGVVPGPETASIQGVKTVKLLTDAAKP
jgi:ABC-type phosphate transport system substrate-binding protein